MSYFYIRSGEPGLFLSKQFIPKFTTGFKHCCYTVINHSGNIPGSKENSKKMSS